MDGLAEDESCWFRPPKSVQGEDSLLVQPKSKVPSTKTSGPLRFSELGKQRASKNSVYLTREACSNIMIFTVCKVSRSGRTGIVFPQTSGSQNSSKKLLIRTVVAIRLVPCMELFVV